MSLLDKKKHNEYLSSVGYYISDSRLEVAILWLNSYDDIISKTTNEEDKLKLVNIRNKIDNYDI